MFSLETWNIWDDRAEHTPKQGKMVAFVGNCLVKRLILASFCCYDYGANASEAVLKIATDQKVYHKRSLYVIVC